MIMFAAGFFMYTVCFHGCKYKLNVKYGYILLKRQKLYDRIKHIMRISVIAGKAKQSSSLCIAAVADSLAMTGKNRMPHNLIFCSR